MTSPGYYMPRDPDFLDTVRYTQRVVDQILRNNPLTDAVVSEGLMRWIGNYTDAGDPNKINFLWIGDFFPADINLPGNPPQRGFSLVRDDSRGGRSAIALYDSNPAASAGLKQQLLISSGDGQRLIEESRDGGWRWPEENVWMGAIGSNTLNWISTTNGSYDTLFEGRLNVTGNQVAYRVFAATTNGATANFRLRVETPGGDTIGTVHSLGANASAVFDSTVNVAVGRGGTYPIRWEAQRTNGSGEARSQVISVRCFTP